MKAFAAIIALTFRNAVRSHVFQLLLLLLLICVTVIPFSISVGKLDDLIRVSLLYSFWSVSIILSLSSLWLGCYVMSKDIDTYQIHMVVSKPVSRITLWLGKWVGINLINIVLLLLSGLVVYCMVMYHYTAAEEESMGANRESEREMVEAERKRIRTQILVGRRSYMPDAQDPEKLAEMIVIGKVNELKKSGKAPTDEEIGKMYDEILKQIDKMPVEILPGKTFTWTYSNLPQELNDVNLIVRFRPYLGKVATEDQGLTAIALGVQDPKLAAANPEGSFLFLPGTYFTGDFHEKTLPAGIIGEDGTARIRLANGDPKNKLYFQNADGPKLLVPVCSFEVNFLRALLVMALQLMLLSGVACAFGGFLTMPTAIFMVVNYLLFGSLGMILTDSEFFVTNVWDSLGQFLAQCLLFIVIPLQKFDVTDLLSNGELIEFSYIGELFVNYFILRGMPLFLLGMFLYWRREMGSAVKK